MLLKQEEDGWLVIEQGLTSFYFKRKFHFKKRSKVYMLSYYYLTNKQVSKISKYAFQLPFKYWNYNTVFYIRYTGATCTCWWVVTPGITNARAGLVWEYFGLEQHKNGKIIDDGDVICRVCWRMFLARNGNMSILLSHLRANHAKVHTQIKENMKELQV